MLQTAPRLLRLLSLLQRPRAWTGPELAEALEVTTRTVRNDMNRLRQLGYPVAGSPGVEGGYRLRPGNDLPPLLLDDQEALSIVIGLQSAATGAIAGIEELSLRTLAKLEQVMPKRLRRRLHAMQRAIVSAPRQTSPLDPDLLTAVARACTEQERLRFEYSDHAGAGSRRTTEPHRVLHDGRRWYLIAWDLDRDDWRTFRIDRIRPRLVTGPPFVPRSAPPKDLVDTVVRGIERATWHYRARVRVHVSAQTLAVRVPKAVAIEPVDEHTCIASVGSDLPERLVLQLAMLDADFEVLDAPELAPHLERVGRRYLWAAKSIVSRS